jgi:hypothetical protein
MPAISETGDLRRRLSNQVVVKKRVEPGNVRIGIQGGDYRCGLHPTR